MFNRVILKELEKWAVKKERKPLILRGARQVGKTTAVKMFSVNFNQFIYLNLEHPDERQLFERDYPFSKLIDAIFFYKEKDKDVDRTLIFIDEIQNAPAAVHLLRFFYEETPHFFVIAAGSLLESLIDNTISFPVGRVEYLAVRPLTFVEFLMATGEEKSLEFLIDLSVPDYAHNKLMDLFKQYTIIGGMPEIIANYVEYHNFYNLREIYEQLIVSYLDDVEKYGRNQTTISVIRHVISSAFMYAGQRITFTKFANSQYRSREMSDAFKTLEKTMLLKLIYPVENLKLPAVSNLRKAPKLQLLDTGLVNYSSGLQKELFVSDLIEVVYLGKIAEHVIGQEILGMESSVRASLNFWTSERRNSQAEVDFIYRYKDMLIPIEVKLGASGKLRSLHQFVNLAPHNWAVRFYSGKMVVEDARTISGKKYKLINLPHYMAGKLDLVLERIIK